MRGKYPIISISDDATLALESQRLVLRRAVVSSVSSVLAVCPGRRQRRLSATTLHLQIGLQEVFPLLRLARTTISASQGSTLAVRVDRTGIGHKSDTRVSVGNSSPTRLGMLRVSNYS